MLGVMLGLALAAAQDVPPLAGTLPPLPPPRAERREDMGPRGPLFISPMGEPFRGPDPVRAWFDAADTDHDGALTLAEFVADADRFFLRLDRGKDGEIDPDDIDYYETVLAPEIRTGGDGGAMAGAPGGERGGGRRGGGRPGGGGGGGRSGGGGGGRGGGGDFGGGDRGETGSGQSTKRYDETKRGAARYSFFDYPEPVTVADTNFNRGIDPREFRVAAAERFALLDTNHDGRISWSELPKLSAPPANQRKRGKRPGGGPGDRGDESDG